MSRTIALIGSTAFAVGAGAFYYLRSQNRESESSKQESPADAVKRTWALVATDLEGNGVALFREIFTIAPGALEMFSFRDDEGLYTSAGLKRHATGVMKTVGVAVDNLDDLEKVVPALKTLGARHVKYGVVEAHYDVVGQALLNTLEKGLGELYTKDVQAAWTHVYSVVASTMKEGARSAA